MGELVGVLLVAAVAGILGVALGIFFLAPRIARLVDRSDEEPGGRDE
jgi:hypothetical protein